MTSFEYIILPRHARLPEEIIAIDALTVCHQTMGSDETAVNLVLVHGGRNVYNLYSIR